MPRSALGADTPTVRTSPSQLSSVANTLSGATAAAALIDTQSGRPQSSGVARMEIDPQPVGNPASGGRALRSPYTPLEQFVATVPAGEPPVTIGESPSGAGFLVGRC